jgi:hypothetical protein
MNIHVVNKKWKIIVRTDKVHNERYPNTHAVAILEDRRIHIRRSSVDVVTILHELVHAYKHELSFYELELDDDQIDEWHCELWAKHGKIMLQDAERLVSQYKK